MMSGYIVSILGVVIAGVIVDVIVPSGEMNKYVKSIYSVFVVAVLVIPIMNIVNGIKNLNLTFDSCEVNTELLNYINNQKINELKNKINIQLKEGGFEGVDIQLNYSTENDNLTINSCVVSLANLVISQDKQHINKYEYISNVVKANTGLLDEVIIFNE